MLLAMDNVVSINSSRELEAAIRLFLSRSLSQATRVAYETDICQFFNVDSLGDIKDWMIKETTPQTARSYFNEAEKEYAGSTVARKISSLKALFNYLRDDRVKGHDGDLLLDGYNPIGNVEVAFESNGYGSFTRDEVGKILDIAMVDDSLFFEILGKTSIRKEACRGLRLKDIIKVDGVWCITGDDKGSKGIRKSFTKAITDDIYNRCVSLVDTYDDGDDRLFRFSSNTPLNRLKKYCSEIGIDEVERKERNLTIHSLKKTGVIIVTEMTNGNTKKIMQQGNHKNAEYAMTTYQKSVYNPHDDPSNLVEFRGYDEDEELLEDLSRKDKHELMDLIMGLDKGMRSVVMKSLR